MDNPRLFEAGPPGLHLVISEPSEFENFFLQLTASHRDGIIRKIRGRKSRTLDEFFSEVGAALQFPYYFGENWPAFSECITDLEWLTGNAYLLLISEANLLLQNADITDFRVLLRILTEANSEWVTPNQYIPRSRPKTAFHVILQCTRSEFTALSERLVQAGIEVDRL